MKFKIERDELLKTLTMVQGVVEKRNTMPILSNILLKTPDSENMQITATDLEVGITTRFPAQIEKTGKITINAKNLMDITKQLPSQTLALEVLENNDVKISCGKILFKLHGLPADDFPALPEVEAQSTFTLPAEKLVEMIDYTVFSVSTDETRYNLSGVYLEQPESGVLRMVSSDGHRLSLIDCKMESPEFKLSDNVIIPRKGLSEIRKLASESDEDIRVTLAKSNCVIEQGPSRLVIRLIDGDFPDYRQVLPSDENQKKITLDREVFLSALKRISILSQEKTRGVRFQFENNTLKIAVNNPDLGEAEEEMEVDFKSASLEIGFNSKYFIDVLNIIKTKQVELHLSDSMSQGLLIPEGELQFRAVIMPMKLL